MKNIVAIGGGHGLSTILSGLKQLDDLSLSAIVTVADDGGSTGRIRERYIIPAMGDVRNVMLSLSDGDQLLRDLMTYRFNGEDNMDIAGHSLGNLILTALTNMSGSFDRAIKTTSEVLKVKGKIIPSTLQYVTLMAKMEDGTIVKGEASIPSLNHHIDTVYYDKIVKANPEAIKAIEEADLIIYSVGSLYTSILPNIIIPTIKEAINNSKAKKVYICNAMTQRKETYGYTVKDHVEALRKHGGEVDMVIMHNEDIPSDVRKRYMDKDCIEVVYNNDLDIEVRKCPLLKFDNSLVRHDGKKIKDAIKEIL